MERSYESTAALAARAAGPRAEHLGQFVASLIDQQYAPSVVYIKARHALAFDRWLAKRCAALAGLGEVHIERYERRSRRRHQSICAETRRRERYDLSEVLQFLRARGVCKTADAIEFVQRQAKRMQPPALKCVVNAMRSFLRYAQYRGEVAPELVAAVPAVATWTTTPPLPRAISPEHAQRAIDSCDRRTSLGLRDRPCYCSWHASGFALTRSSRYSGTTATGTPVACGCAARAGANASCRCLPMWVRPSPLICNEEGLRAPIGIYSCAPWRRSAVLCPARTPSARSCVTHSGVPTSTLPTRVRISSAMR